MQMKALGLLALTGCLLGSACASSQSADPSSVLANQSDLARIRQAILPCLKRTWVPPAKGQSARVTLRWRLDEDGRLLGSPEIVDPQISPYYPAAQAATRAVQACDPFKLPVVDSHLSKQVV